ncbi:hypothetical protein [Cyclobacterium marinum]|uniref:Uncharacterized protein n=1 Tax=Cyclobacterium marinum (strain ATCC 25205 / DSM 745 / LMG 13164 / NCIMB 1802) TaxID=880070 RepID=G0J384_CYCMS|nr:hypothetical protein [Cyclobacterium marinum]AEL24025.1 hypothetical protein Cycma_0243 [Cyclobacterium marinum DSM 745]|tara:strand:+ start:605 stop:847 length:243 start_codon:yes stop_codon:yes gene_type:complete
MTQFQKKFIGKGSKVNNMDIVRVTISKETIEEILKSDLVKYQEKEYLIFEVAALKSKDNYGRSHTAYISKKSKTKPKSKK